MRSVLVLSLGLVAGAALAADTPSRAADDQARLAKELHGLSPKRTDTCLWDDRSQRQTIGIGPVILYRVGRATVYRNDTSGGCEGIARGDILVTRSFTGRTCRGDIARTIDPTSGFPTGSCTLGPFTTYSAK